MTRIVVFDWIKVTLKVFIIVTHVSLITAAMRQDLLFPFWIDQAVPPFWIISSFLLASAFERHGSSRAQDELTWKILGSRLSRVAVPYTVVFACMLFLIFHRPTGVSALASSLVGVDCSQLGGALSVAILWLAGGVGPGGYYVPILFQMYLVFPLLYAIFRKKPLSMSIAILTATIAWEVAFASGVISDQAYRLLIVRYLVFLLLGVWFYRLWDSGYLSLTVRSAIATIFCFSLGAGYLAAVNYCGFPPLAGGDWMSTSWITALYSGSIFYVLLALYAGWAGVGAQRFGKVSRFVEYLSRAALHVYLFQMLYFYFVNAHLQKLATLPLWAVVAGSVLVCVTAGVALYWCESHIRRRIERIRSKPSELQELNLAETPLS